MEKEPNGKGDIKNTETMEWNNPKIKAPGFCSCYSSPARDSLLGHLGHLLHLSHVPFVL